LVLTLAVAGIGFAGGEQEAGEGTATAAAAEPAGKEAPDLAALVAAGELPPLEERLPTEPLVIEPRDEIGVYGGTWRRVNFRLFQNWYSWEPLLKLDMETFEPIPNIAKDWEVSEDYTKFTFYLREGMKWSDGAPFTSEDLMFFYEDLFMNDELTPGKPSWLTTAGEPVTMSAPDEYTVVFEFAGPKILFLQEQAGMGRPNYIQAPKHYLSQFHPDYADADDLQALLDAEGMDSWIQLMEAKRTVNENPDLPVLAPWDLDTDSSAELQVATRNPYYWKVDTQGNQLPYIDSMTWPLKADAQVTLLKAISGEVDFDRVSKVAGDMTVLKENEASGGYEAKMLNLDSHANSLTLFVNQDFIGDEETAKVLQDVKFRRALSVAIDREELIEFTVLGLAEPRQAVLHSTSPGGSEEYSKAYTEFDPEQAAAWLDEAGLNERDRDGWRKLPNGETFELILAAQAGRQLSVDSGEIIKRQLEEIGIKTALKLEDGALYFTRLEAGEHMISIGGNGEGLNPLRKPHHYYPITGRQCPWAPLQGLYYQTDGRDGSEPSGYQVELIDLYEEAVDELDEATRVEIFERTMEIHSQQLFQIGTMGYAGFPMVVSNKMHNTPKRLANVYQNAPAFDAEQYFIRE
jgi:peptide/nickel transport system substrate-binding protein